MFILLLFFEDRFLKSDLHVPCQDIKLLFVHKNIKNAHMKITDHSKVNFYLPVYI